MSRGKTLGVLSGAGFALVQQHQMRKTGVNQPGHAKDTSAGHKMTMVNSKGRMTTGPGKTGGSNNGVTKGGPVNKFAVVGSSGQPAGLPTTKRSG